MTKFWSVIIGGFVTLTPLVVGLTFFLDPILRKKKAAEASGGEGSPGEGFLNVISESALPDDGRPVFQQIRKNVVDAWNTYIDQPVGAVYLRKTESGAITAFNSECPHLGCTVSYLESANQYKCPCHDSKFQLDGERTNQIPPRPMDELDVKVDDEGNVWVKFQSYKIGVAEQIPKN
ncbi:MAG: Rieske (2Fe-2S) protein [Planctomycetaceae bacterium]|nr:Rieske (2Fe-2S) protein [Planctomycetaceae bacterium]